MVSMLCFQVCAKRSTSFHAGGREDSNRASGSVATVATRRRALSGWSGLTSNDLGALEVLVRVKVARRQGKPQADEEQEKVGTSPHVVIGFFLVDPSWALARPGGWLCSC